MSVLNRPMFQKQVVKRFSGSSQRGESSMNPEPMFTRLFEAMKRLTPNYDPENDDFRQTEIKNTNEDLKNATLSELYNLILQQDPDTPLQKGQMASEEIMQRNPELYSLYNAFFSEEIDQKELADDLKKLMNKEQTPPNMADGGEVNGLKDIEMRFRQEGSPKQGENIKAENVGIMDGFDENTAQEIVKSGEKSKEKIDSAEDYSQLMNSTRGNEASEEDRRDELAKYVGEKDAEKTPDSVLALIQPLMQMLDTEAGQTGIAMSEQAQMNMPQPTPQTQGGIPGFKDGGIVKRFSGSPLTGEIMNFEDIYLKESGVQENRDMKTAENLLNFINSAEMIDEDNDSELKKKYDANYKVFQDILGGQGPSKDQMQGEMLTQVVAPLAFAYASGADLPTVLAQGSQKIGEMATMYDKLKRKDEAAIRNIALQQALKKEDVGDLKKVFLKDNPDTEEDEGAIAVYRSEKDILENKDLYTAESTKDVIQRQQKEDLNISKLNMENALLEYDLKYKDLEKQIGIAEKEEIIQSIIMENKLKQIDIDTKPEILAAQLKEINLGNAAKLIDNEFLRSNKIVELETASADLDIKLQDLKRKTIENKYVEELQKLNVDEKQAFINLKLQEEDFNEVNNVLLIEQKKAEIDNLVLQGKNLTLENEYDALKNKYADEGFSLENENKKLDNLNLQQENIKLSIENEFLPEEKKLALDKVNQEIKALEETTYGQLIENAKGEIELNNYSQETELKLNKLKLENEVLQYKIDNPAKDWTKSKTVLDFKNKWMDSSITKNTTERQNMMQALVTSAQQESGPGDISFIFQYMKFLDPNSVVRENEFATAANAGGVPENVRNLFNKIQAGEILPDTVKEDFLKTASDLYLIQIDNYMNQYNTEKAIAERMFGADEVQNAIPMLTIDAKLIEGIKNGNRFDNYLESIK